MKLLKNCKSFETLVNQAIETNSDFAYEGHFSTESPWPVIRRFRENNYRITMFFLMVKTLELSQKRVTERVKTGGHYVTPTEIERNYYGNLIQLNQKYLLMDELIIADNTSIKAPNLLFHRVNNRHLFKLDNLPDWYQKYLPNLM